MRRPSLAAAIGLFMLTGGGAAAAQPESQTAPPLFHGHWCGAGDDHRAAPKDAFDAACRAHDLCYEKKGRGACSCDQDFLKATARLVTDPKTAETLRGKVATANSLFSAAPCIEDTRSSKRARN